MNLLAGTTQLKNLGHLNVILGKNGVGKSELLRTLDKELGAQKDKWLIKYISPERGGELIFNSAVEQNLRYGSGGTGEWGATARRKNRVDSFKHMSFWEYRNFETLVLRKIDKDRTAPSFADTMQRINSLLDNVELVSGSKADPALRRKSDNELQRAETLSSGESELLSLGIEILSFCHQAAHEDNADVSTLLLLDEPDVHLHPDLQHRLMKLVVTATTEAKITTIVASHSTALLGALEGGGARVAFMKKGEANVESE
jgi:predicted ATP-dependent endonuclease of OLD family